MYSEGRRLKIWGAGGKSNKSSFWPFSLPSSYYLFPYIYVCTYFFQHWFSFFTPTSFLDVFMNGTHSSSFFTFNWQYHSWFLTVLHSWVNQQFSVNALFDPSINALFLWCRITYKWVIGSVNLWAVSCCQILTDTSRWNWWQSYSQTLEYHSFYNLAWLPSRLLAWTFWKYYKLVLPTRLLFPGSHI